MAAKSRNGSSQQKRTRLNQHKSNTTDPIRLADLESLLDDTFLRSVTRYDQTDSTNTRAIELLAADKAEPTPRLVYAESQIAGRGRGANQWWSANGSLTFSLVVDFRKLALSADRKPLLPLLTGMAILRTGKRLLPDADFKLKWPNDVYLANQKLAGVLIEVPSQSSDHAVIGVGLNVNNSFADAPKELSTTGTSFADNSKSQHSRIEILRSLMQDIASLLDSSNADRTLLNDWPDHCLLTDKQVTLQTGSTEITGRCLGIDASGALILETSSGPQSFFGGVVESWI